MQFRSTIVQLTVGVVVGFGVSACAPYQSLKGYDERPMVASMQPVGVVVAPTPPPVEQEDDSAGALLERGFLYFHQDELEEASAAFAGAIATGNLNDAGRALAYWHIAESNRRLHDEDRTAEALSSFAVVAQDVVNMRDRRRFAVDEDGDFVSNFRLQSRIAEARGYVNAVWARRADHYGRSMENPIIVSSEEEVEYFVRFVSPCSGTPFSQAHREILSTGEGEAGESVRVERVTVFCYSVDSSDQYYLVISSAAEATEDAEELGN